jgi:hypothetical protein
MLSHVAKAWRGWLVPAILVVVSACAGCPRGTGSSDEVTSSRERCPEHHIAIDVDSTDLVTDIPLASTIDEIPEFHDCQRFATSARNGYGPLVAIWSVDDLGEVFRADLAPQTPDADTSAVRQALTPPWRAVAQIFNYDNVAYGELGIQPYFNCLQLRRLPSPTGRTSRWAARIVPTYKDPKACAAEDRRDTLGFMALEVRSTAAPPALLPSVARWDREPAPPGRQYIGIRCGNEWCEIGPKDFASSPGLPNTPIQAAYLAEFEEMPGAPATPAVEKLSVIQIKGWYDQQMLAEFDGSSLRRTSVLGTIIPHPGLKGIAHNERFAGQWIPSAYVHVTAAYKGFEPPAGARALNRISICLETAGRSCAGAPAASAASVCSAPGGDRWWAAIDRPTSGREIRCVHFDGKSTVIPAAAARWRWLETDEKTWVRCAEGCCSSN